MAKISKLEWLSIEQASQEYELHEARIKKAEADIERLKKGLIKLTDISANQDRVEARLNWERKLSPLSDQSSEVVLERVIGRPDFQDASILQKLVNYAKAVGRVICSDGTFGTGWLIGEDLLLTNQHVLPAADVARSAEFNLGYERNIDGSISNGDNFKLRPDVFFLTPPGPTSVNKEFLDFTVVSVEPTNRLGKSLRDYGFVTVNPQIGKVIEGENCMVIQHPEGDYKKVVLRDIRLLLVEDVAGADLHLFYESDTLKGSSGGMVIALGTGEIIALHNAGVPRRNSQGRYLKKDGTVWSSGDPEDTIDWIANQGVRISRLVKNIKNLPLQDSNMEVIRRNLINSMEPNQTSFEPPIVDIIQTSEPEINSVNPAIETDTVLMPPTGRSDYLVLIKNGAYNFDFVRENIRATFPDAKIDRLSISATSDLYDKYMKVSFTHQRDVWQTAGELEKVDGVEEAEPEIERFTTLRKFETDKQADSPLLYESYSSSQPKTELDHWPNSAYLKGLSSTNPADLPKIRKWNHDAVNFDGAKIKSALSDKEKANLEKIRIAQFDTGYTIHSKVAEGFDFLLDYDAVDGDPDAQDERAWVNILRHYRHGLRTGSLIIGKDWSDLPPEKEGNLGLLRAISDTLKITPYRVTRSVILIRRIAELVEAADMAMGVPHHIFTMSLGILPGTRALRDIVRKAYEKGIIWCTAAGNEIGLVVAPGTYPGTICVAASNPDDLPWNKSCRGIAVDITAPGEDIYVPTFDKNLREDMSYGSGTSYATPHVSCAAALWLAKNAAAINNRYSSGWQIVEAFRCCLHRTARKTSGLPEGFGAGILDIDALLNQELPNPLELKHAYLEQKEAGNFSTSVTHRELLHRDCLNYINKSLGRQSPFLDLVESTGNRLPERQSVTLYKRLLEKELAPQNSVSFTESTSTDSDAYDSLKRIRLLQASLEYSKPKYSPKNDQK